jgi:hypothetical protein
MASQGLKEVLDPGFTPDEQAQFLQSMFASSIGGRDEQIRLLGHLLSKWRELGEQPRFQTEATEYQIGKSREVALKDNRRAPLASDKESYAESGKKLLQKIPETLTSFYSDPLGAACPRVVHGEPCLMIAGRGANDHERMLDDARHFRGVKVVNGKFGAQLKGSELEFENMDLSGLDLSRVHLEFATFKGGSLKGARFVDSVLFTGRRPLLRHGGCAEITRPVARVRSDAATT